MCCIFFAIGQEYSPSTNYLQNITEYNPAYLGKDYTFRVHAQHTQTFYNNVHQPMRQFFMYEQHFDSLNSAIGIQADQLRYGIMRHRNYLLAYRYEWRLSSDFSMLLGLSGGVSSLHFDDTPILYPTPVPDFIGTHDYQPVINGGLAAAWRMLTFGYSARQFNRPYFEKSFIQMTIQHTLFGRYLYQINRKLILHATLLAYTHNGFHTIQPAVRMDYNHQFFVQIGSRNTEGIHLSAGITLKKHVSIGYSFESLNENILSNSRIQQHEVFMSYQRIRKPRPRFMFSGTPSF
jgi:type IX secretion system PorP/SprF family membrane protein